MSPMLAATMSSRVLTIATQLVVGSLLTPSQFGEFAIALALCTFLSLFQSADLSRLALQDHADPLRSAARMRSTLLLGCTLTTLIVLVVLRFDQGKVDPWFAACLLLLPFLRVMANTRVTLLSAQGASSRIAGAAFVEAITRSLSSIALALAGLGAWSLVIAEVCAMFASVLVLNHFCAGPDDAMPALRRSVLRPLAAVTVAGVLNLVERELPVLAVGVMLGSTAAGSFAFAHRIATQLIILVFPMIAVESIPRLIAAVKDPAAFEIVRLRERRRLLKTCVVLALLLGVCAPPAIYLVWGERWLDAARVLPILVAAVLLRLGYLFNRGLLEATGRMRAMLYLSFFDAVLIVVAILGSLSFGGALWLASALAGQALAAYLISRAVVFVK